ncbi:MAG: UvrD-helicase domain-containing protein [Clostridia bacterium]|nr:UvrD-helicase domain-containing protein [Clostridia bacterium]
MSDIHFDEDQEQVLASEDNIIVPASAGSGKTTVMIERLVRALYNTDNPVSLNNVLAVTFTDDAAASMKTKLCDSIKNGISGTKLNRDQKNLLKEQLELVPSADISTIHSFCAKLVRRYFFLAGCDGTFDILSDETQKKDIMKQAVDQLFDELYEELKANPACEFGALLKCYGRKQKDDDLRQLVISVYSKLRSVSNYRKVLDDTVEKYDSPEGFELVYNDMRNMCRESFEVLKQDISNFDTQFEDIHMQYLDNKSADTIQAQLEDMYKSLNLQMRSVTIDTDPKKKLIIGSAPPVTKKHEGKTKEALAMYGHMKGLFSNIYKGIGTTIADKDTERVRYAETWKISKAFISVLLRFDDRYSEFKKELNVLDYDDLEHFAIDLLGRREVRKDVWNKYKLVFVDEYQDINPVQDTIISALTGENEKDESFRPKDVKSFFVGDVKQAIYGFRGSKSEMFMTKVKDFKDPGKTGYSYQPMNYNHRSMPEIIDGVNNIFRVTMQGKKGGVYPDLDYSDKKEIMKPWKKAMPADKDGNCLSSGVKMVVFGDSKEEKEIPPDIYPVYSVKNYPPATKESRQGLAVVQIVHELLEKKRYDADIIKEDGECGDWVRIKPKDICILGRTKEGAEKVEKVLKQYGYPVSSVEMENICDNSYVKQMLDILSYVANPNQDTPLATALLSPLGNLTENNLAEIRITSVHKSTPFYKACWAYMKNAEKAAMDGGQLNATALKLVAFYDTVKDLRSASYVMSADAVIEKVLGINGFTSQYPEDDGETMRFIRELVKQGADLSVTAFLKKVEKSGNILPVKASAHSDCIKIMTIHGSKGLEFPIVIITDICVAYDNSKEDAISFNMEYGLAPFYYDEGQRYEDIKKPDKSRKLKYTTILRELEHSRKKLEENRNEVNVFYVACTRAINNLYIMTAKKPGIYYDDKYNVYVHQDYLVSNARQANNYYDLINFDEFMTDMNVIDWSDRSIKDLLSTADKARYTPESVQEPAKLVGRAECSAGNSIPLFSSASAMVKAAEEDEEKSDSAEASMREWADIQSTEDYDGHAAERGTAYHRFLELCDFSIKDESGIQKELGGFVSSSKMSAEEAGYLNIQHLKDIVSMDVFKCLDGAEDVRREQGFYCPVPAKKYMSGMDSDDGEDDKEDEKDDKVIVQGAMDLLVKRDGRWQIIDYKYSDKSPDQIKAYYAPQIKVYRQVLSRITGQAVDDIPAAIVNIKNHFTVKM